MRRAVDDDIIHPESLSVLAAACRDHEHVRFDYRRSDGESSSRHRRAAPARHGRASLVSRGVGRTSRRLANVPTGPAPGTAAGRQSFHATRDPGRRRGGASSRPLSASLPRHHEAKLAIHATLAEIDGVLRWVDHTLLEVEADRCVVQIRSEDLGRLAMTVADIALTAPVIVIEPAELADTIRRLAVRLAAREQAA